MTASGILDRIVATKRDELLHLFPRKGELRALAADAPPAREFRAALRRPGEVTLLAEIKPRSPSAGEIRPGADPAAVARAYAAAGAAALSVLTDRTYFGGELGSIARVRAAVDLPAMRKDFLIDPLHLWESRAAGADAVLLIVRILADAQLRDLLGLAAELGMDVLVETHDADEVGRALDAGASVIGVNNRDLDTLVTTLGLAPRLAPGIPESVVLVAESGISRPEDVLRMGAAGADAVLVGESLMRRERIEPAAAALVGHPRADGVRPR
jgi:indole-3-glycerol phosphate synthase